MIKQNLAFTIIELVIAIAIISILSSISVAVYYNHRIESAKKVLLSDTKNCLNDCIVQTANVSIVCSDCKIGKFTESCTIDLNGPVYVKCEGKGIITGFSCSVYQSGQIDCS